MEKLLKVLLYVWESIFMCTDLHMSVCIYKVSVKLLRNAIISRNTIYGMEKMAQNP